MFRTGPVDRKLGQIVQVKKTHIRGLLAGCGLSSDYLAQKNNLEGVVEFHRPSSPIGIEHGNHLDRLHIESALFPHLSDNGLCRGLAHIGPPSGHGPFAVHPLLDEQKLPVPDHRPPHIHLDRGIARLGQKILFQLLG